METRVRSEADVSADENSTIIIVTKESIANLLAPMILQSIVISCSVFVFRACPFVCQPFDYMHQAVHKPQYTA